MNILEKFYEWKNWEGIMHHVYFVFFIYIIYVLIINKKTRTLQNILLFTIVIALGTLLHQNINIKNNNKTLYNFF
jgi:hypothetical protein